MLISKTSQSLYSKSLLKKTKEWLGEDGTRFFIKNLLKHDTISPVLSDGVIPHAVHFREGMQVRNFLRSLPECEDWNSEKLDDNWVQVIEEAIGYGKSKTI